MINNVPANQSPKGNVRHIEQHRFYVENTGFTIRAVSFLSLGFHKEPYLPNTVSTACITVTLEFMVQYVLIFFAFALNLCGSTTVLPRFPL